MKLSLEILKERVKTFDSQELMETISGGYVADCHSGFAVAWGTWLFETGFGR